MLETFSVLWEYAPVWIPGSVTLGLLSGFLFAIKRIETEVSQGRIREGLKWAVLGFVLGNAAFFFGAWTLRNGMNVF